MYSCFSLWTENELLMYSIMPTDFESKMKYPTMTIWVHHDVGYVDLKHLMPAYGGLLGLLIGSALTYGYLVIPHRLDEPTAR